MFVRYSLRTVEIDAARAFYRDAVGLALPDGASEGSALESWPLHERARAAGAPPHWLGHVETQDVEATAARLVELGAQALGPSVTTRDGVAYATVRDPFGAVVSVRGEGLGARHAPVAWHHLHSADADGSWRVYSELFGWVEAGRIEAPDLEGGHRLFAWTAGGAPVGSVANTARWPGVHAHWLFHFPVADVEAAARRVRELGGTAMGVVELTGGARVTACEDPQGAAFGLLQRG
ncbi:MAG: hypothetical protein H6719_36095 [Sandaracinaceae bacterium]|nr:hypothetical protein [Sandaracinaceae bacterium]